MIKKKLTESHRSRPRHMITLNRWRSETALLSCTITIIAAAYAIVSSLLEFVPDEKAATSLYQFLTPNANTMTALAAALIVPFAIEGIRKKRFTYPKWIGNAEGDDEMERRVDSVLERFDRRYRTKKRVSRSISQLIFFLGLTSFIYGWRLEPSWTIFRFMTDMDMVPQYRLKGAWGRQNSGA